MHRQQLQLGVVQVEPIAFVGQPFTRQQPANHADRFVLAITQQHGIDTKHVGIRRQCTWPGAENGPAAGHMVELHDALCDVKWVVVRQRHHTGAEVDPMGAFTSSGQEHLGRRDDFPAGRVMLAAPEFVEPKLIELLDESEVAPVLQDRVFANGMMGRRKAPNLMGFIWSPASSTTLTGLLDRPS